MYHVPRSNLDAATLRPAETLGTIAAASEVPPAAGVAAVYGVVSIFGQVNAGASQIAQAVTGNFSGDAHNIEQISNVLAGPAFGLGTMLATHGNIDIAERNANRESVYTTGAGLVDKSIPMLQRAAEFGLSILGITSSSTCHQ